MTLLPGGNRAAEHGADCDILVCIYTCEGHRGLHDTFYRSILGQHLLQLPDSRMLEVYADPDAGCSCHRGNELIVRSPERYDALPLKTYEMIRYCVDTFAFRRLVKIDVTTVQIHFEGPEYEGRTAIDLGMVVRFLVESSPDADYDGFHRRARVTRSLAENWAAKKGLRMDYGRVFGTGPVTPFFSGKAYVVSHAFARFIRDHGAETAREHAEFFPGAEDVMIGRLYDRFAGSGS